MKIESARMLVIRSRLLHSVFTSERMCLCVHARVHTIRGDAENSIFVYRRLCLPWSEWPGNERGILGQISMVFCFPSLSENF